MCVCVRVFFLVLKKEEKKNMPVVTPRVISETVSYNISQEEEIIKNGETVSISRENAVFTGKFNCVFFFVLHLFFFFFK